MVAKRMVRNIESEKLELNAPILRKITVHVVLISFGVKFDRESMLGESTKSSHHTKTISRVHQPAQVTPEQRQAFGAEMVDANLTAAQVGYIYILRALVARQRRIGT